jgi:hypothetical protein
MAIRQVARRIAASNNPLRELAQHRSEYFTSAELERLTLPPEQLTYRECHDAVELYGSLFKLVRDDIRLEYGAKAIQYLRQYIELADIREKTWKRLKAKDHPIGNNRTLPAIAAAMAGDGLDVSEYHNGFYCVHLWYDGGHAKTSFVMDPEGDLKYATLDFAARIVGDALGQPRTSGEAVSFLREVLRVLPYESKVVSSVQDIPPPALSRMSKEDATLVKSRWDSFVDGVGRSITRPMRTKSYGDAEYVIYVYRRLGGRVIRYSLHCSRVRHVPVRVQEETVASWVGDCWGIM